MRLHTFDIPTLFRLVLTEARPVPAEDRPEGEARVEYARANRSLRIGQPLRQTPFTEKYE